MIFRLPTNWLHFFRKNTLATIHPSYDNVNLQSILFQTRRETCIRLVFAHTRKQARCWFARLTVVLHNHMDRKGRNFNRNRWTGPTEPTEQIWHKCTAPPFLPLSQTHKGPLDTHTHLEHRNPKPTPAWLDATDRERKHV